MSFQILTVPLRDKRNGELVEASLVDEITEKQLRDVEEHWLPSLREAIERLITEDRREDWPQSQHWKWRNKVEHARGILAYRGFAIEYDDHTQGLMLVSTTEECRLPSQKGKPLVYIDYLETAPWNQRNLFKEPRFGGIGTVMLAVSIHLSQSEGFSGRIGLHSLPQSENFYDACGMSRVGNDPAKQGLTYFEMTPQQANAFIDK